MPPADPTVAWLVANVPELALWVALALAGIRVVIGLVYHFTRGVRVFEQGYRDGQKVRAKLLDSDSPVC